MVFSVVTCHISTSAGSSMNEPQSMAFSVPPQMKTENTKAQVNTLVKSAPFLLESLMLWKKALQAAIRRIIKRCVKSVCVRAVTYGYEEKMPIRALSVSG